MVLPVSSAIKRGKGIAMSNNSISEHQKVIDHTDAITRKELVDIHALLIDGLINHDREKCISYFEKHYGFVEQSIG